MSETGDFHDEGVGPEAGDEYADDPEGAAEVRAEVEGEHGG